MKKKSELVKNGLRHGLINTIPNSVKASQEEKIKETVKEKYNKEKKKNNELVKCRFVRYKSPNESLEISHLMHADDNITQWRFLPNEVYEIPRGLMEKVNSHFQKNRTKEEIDRNTSSLDRPLSFDMNAEKEKIYEFVGVLE